VRVLRPEFVGQPRLLAQFLDVSKRSYAYAHQGLVHTRDVQAIPDHRIYFTVRDYVEGVTLQAVLSEGRRFEPAQSLEILRQTLEALTPVHLEGAFHGGIKPSNLFLCGGERVRVVLGDPSLPVTGAADLDRLSYDYRYAPPELFRGGEAPGPRSDFYSLGCLAYELLCGAPPFVSDNAFELIARHGQEAIPPPSRQGSALGPRGDAWVMHLLAKSPAQRFAGLDGALGALEALQDSLRPRSGASPPPVSILGQESLARYDAPESVLRITGPPGTFWKSDLGTASLPPEDAIIPPDAGAPAPTPPSAGHSDLPAGTVSDTGGPDPISSPAGRPELSQGTVFGGRYSITRLIGQGGMGSVYLAWDTTLERDVALKIPHFVGGEQEARARFRREARAVAFLDHPNICRIHDVGRIDAVDYLTMPYVEGRTLSTALREGGRLPERDAAQIVRTLAEAIGFAHDRGVIHRDLKPSNVIMNPDLGPVIMDFGLARRASDDDVFSTRPGSLLGTPAYMSPEQVTGDVRAIGPATDIYGLGVVFYELLSGRHPFRGKTVYEVLSAILHQEPEPLTSERPDLDPRLERICRKAMAKRIEDRYSSMHALAEDLDRYLAGKPDQHGAPWSEAGWWRRLKKFFGSRSRSGPM
jgi:serine/threonine protein kinase